VRSRNGIVVKLIMLLHGSKEEPDAHGPCIGMPGEA